MTFRPDLEQLGHTLSSLSHQVSGLALVDNTPEGIQINLKHFQQEGEQRGTEPWIFWPNHRNLGLAAAQNIGLRLAIEHGYSHVLLSDQDTTFHDDAVDHLLAAHEALSLSGHRVAAVAAGFEHPLKPAQEEVVFLRHEGLFWKRVHRSQGLCRISYAIAAGTLIPTAVLPRIGLMDESLFIDWVDVAWCLQAARQGFELYGSADARTSHRLGESMGTLLGRPVALHAAQRSYFITRNALRLALHLPAPRGPQRLRFLWLALLYACVMPWISATPGLHGRMAWRGVRDGLRNRGGPLPTARRQGHAA
ncbi:glycosyltransferase family 2 protein [Cyanobium sp. NIES-981]|uniref:glycosyltransferase family 2 protein n=1 Tax=Cyanobium sp. NIES-981 TaxID=1851505 RepID=UPI0012F95CD2|nr:glycosyltransferase family 2 protein [Cyanobium sp. NIES-981]